ncbi:hypothetical protein GJ698_14930 [Pseudoduganella sp. FT26W]|uniref:Uncharacterized protein n=1 Tax=Duganella aquatilis TaxID=2666082 RepID=A0A844CZS1_9BURK|nr:hypothetical protein [Duganella aquatilis]MRW85378.1 hypothetical protein [Duganella aquatilis]
MNARVTPAAAAALKQAAAQAMPKDRVSVYEQAFGQFAEELILQTRGAGVSVEPYLRNLNRIATLTAGLGAVLRIVAGNCVVADTFDAENPAMEPPLGSYTVNVLTNMAAEVCELITDDISGSADKLRDEVQP